MRVFPITYERMLSLDQVVELIWNMPGAEGVKNLWVPASWYHKIADADGKQWRFLYSEGTGMVVVIDEDEVSVTFPQPSGVRHPFTIAFKSWLAERQRSQLQNTVLGVPWEG